MLLTKTDAHELEFEARTPASPLVLGAVPLGALAVVFLLWPAPYDAARLVASGALLVLAAFVFLRSLPHARPAKLDLERRRLALPDGAEVNCAAARALALSAAPALTSTTATYLYRVELELGPGQRVTLLEHADPARVLTDLAALLRHLELPVRTGWGLPPDATPWLAGEPSSGKPRLSSAALTAVPFPAQRSSGLTLLIGSLGIGAIMLLMYLARLERGAMTSALSLILSVTTLLVLITVALALLGDRQRLTIAGDAITLERRVLGLTRRRHTFARASLCGAWPVSPGAAEAHHLVIQTLSGVIAVPCTGAGARRLAAALSGRG